MSEPQVQSDSEGLTTALLLALVLLLVAGGMAAIFLLYRVRTTQMMAAEALLAEREARQRAEDAKGAEGTSRSDTAAFQSSRKAELQVPPHDAAVEVLGSSDPHAQQLLLAGEPTVLFTDSLKGRVHEGWSWKREDAKTWRHTDKGLEIRVEPGLAATVKNALVRNAPPRSQGKFAIEVTVEFTAAPTKQYEQAGLTWYQGDKPVFKLVHEHIDQATYIIPGKKPTTTRLVQLRLIVSPKEYVAQYRPNARGDFETTASGQLDPGTDEKVSLQCYQGPADAAHWIRFSDFRILQLAE
jgi:hypothetical protein